MGFSRRSLKPYTAEFLGTTLLVLIGDGVVAQCLLSDYTYGTWLSINLAWASAVVLTLYISRPPPTCNPAITLALALLRPPSGTAAAKNKKKTTTTTTTRTTRWRWLSRSLPQQEHALILVGKLTAQFLGGFTGAALVYAAYYAAIARWDPEYTVPGGSILSPQGHHSAGIFATYPSADFSSNWEAVLTEALGASVLMFGVLAIGDDSTAAGPNKKQERRHGGRGSSSSSSKKGKGQGKESVGGKQEFAVFALLLAIGAAFGWQTGYAVNPARDFGPRLFSSLVYGREVFSAKGWYFAVPLFAPVLGCLLGTVLYDAFLYEGSGSVVADALDRLESLGSGSIRLGDGGEEDEYEDDEDDEEDGDDVEAPGAWRD